MSTTTESLIIDIQARNEDKVKSLKSQIREATDEAGRLAEQYGEFDKRTVGAIKRLAELKDVQSDLNNRVKALSPDRFERIATIGQGLVGGYQAFSGVMGLIGAQSKDWEKTMVRLQSLISISQGLQSFKEARESISLLTTGIGTHLKNAFTTAAGAARAVGAALGIGIILAAVTSIAAYWDDIKESISGVSAETRKAADEAERKKNAAHDEVEALNLQENSLRLQGYSERQILELKIAKYNAEIENSKVAIQSQEKIAQAQIEADERNKRILSGILKFLTAPLQLVVDTTARVLKAFGKDFEFNIADKISGLIFDPAATKAEAEKTKAESEKAIKELISQRDGFLLSIRTMDKTASDKRLADQKKANEDALREQKEWHNKVLKEQDDFKKQIDGIEETFRVANVNATRAEKKELNDIEDNFIESEKARIASRDALHDREKRKAREVTEYKKLLRDMELAGTQALLGNLSQLIGQSTATGKVFALAEVGISEGRALASALANSQSPTPDNAATGGLSGLAKFLTIAASITSTAIKARSIIKGGGGAGSNLNAPATSNNANIQQFQSLQLGNGTQSGGTGQYTTVLPVESLNGVNRRVSRTRSIASME